MTERLQKTIAAAGVCSRREAERLIAEGEVAVNGETVRRPGVLVDPARDRIEVMGRRIRPAKGRVYLALNKPRGCVTTAKDPEGRPTVLDLVAGIGERVFPVGRLDYNAEGLLLMTNDGALAYELMRPGGVEKTYRVKVKGTPSPESLQRLREGMSLEGRRLLPVAARIESRGENSWLRLRLHEGKQNQIVRMLQSLGHPVRRLRRTGIGPLQLGALPTGRFRALDPDEVDALRRALPRRSSREISDRDVPRRRSRSAGRKRPVLHASRGAR